MRLVSIELENIRSYERGIVSFPEGSVLLSGDIGCGKSTLLLATEFALFGIRRGELSGSSLLRRGQKRGSVRLTFSLDDDEIVIERTLKRTTSSISQDSGRIIVDGVEYDYTPTELKARILQLLGYPQELLEKQKSLLYRYTVYTPQEKLKSIMWAKPDERLDSLRKVFGVDRYRLIQENLGQFLVSLRAKKRDLSGIHKDLDEKIGARDELKGELEGIGKQIEDLIIDETRIKEELEKWRSEKTAIEEQVKTYNALQIELTKESGRIPGKEKELETATINVTESKKLIEEIDGMKSPTKLSNSEIEKQIKDMDKRRVKCLKDPRGESESIDALIKNITDVAKSQEETRKESTRTDTMIETFVTGKMKLKAAGDICPICGKDLDEKHKKKKIADYDKEIETLEQRQDELAFNRETLNAEEKELDEKYNNEQDRLVKAIGKEKDELEQLRDALKEYDDKVGLRDGLVKLAETSKSSQTSLTEELEKIEKTIVGLNKKIEGLGDVDQKKTEIEEEIERVLSELTEVTTNLATERANKKQFNIRIKELNKDIKHKKDARSFESKLSAFQNWLGDHLINLASTIEKHYMVELKRKFDPIFSEWFNLLIDDEQLDVRIDDEFTPVIEQDGYEAEYENLSGGESASVALAYRLALILDEPTDGFSNDQMDKIRDVVNQLGAKQTIIVSHEPKIESYVDNIVRIRKEDGISKIHS
ncbi:MAG: AAA family ATPase [Candidatus Thorarchaeota archaeon]|jgi:exonuclease SbcC